jgi:8-oxo-dGTP pyrophosphatase MutT (NUDIX family)
LCVGLIDFFSILLPGALLTYLLEPRFFDQQSPELSSGQGWMVFFFCSYLLGHLLFLAGSRLDDIVYDPLRNMTDRSQITRLLNGRSLSPRFPRWLAQFIFKRRPDAAIDRILTIKEHYLMRIGAADTVNAFQWCKARLVLEHPEALGIVNRFEADSKFFRSFVSVLLIVLFMTVYQRRLRLAEMSIWLILSLLALLMFACWRYMEQRFKATQHTYWTVLTLEGGKEPKAAGCGLLPAFQHPEETSVPTHAGGVVYRSRSQTIEYLLVQAKTDPDLWVLPKGHIGPGEKSRRCAIREVREETGVWGRIKRQQLEPNVEATDVALPVRSYTVNKELHRVQYFLMEFIEEGRAEDLQREHRWLPLKEALKLARLKDTHGLLQEADERRTALVPGNSSRFPPRIRYSTD